MAVLFVLWDAPTADAASPPTPRHVTARGVIVGADRSAVLAARRFLCPHGGTPMRGGRCRSGGGAMALAAGGSDPSVRGWDTGLPAVTHRQSPCPAGTVQAPVRLWADAQRCVPN